MRKRKKLHFFRFVEKLKYIFYKKNCKFFQEAIKFGGPRPKGLQGHQWLSYSDVPEIYRWSSCLDHTKASFWRVSWSSGSQFPWVKCWRKKCQIWDFCQKLKIFWKRAFRGRQDRRSPVKRGNFGLIFLFIKLCTYSTLLLFILAISC